MPEQAGAVVAHVLVHEEKLPGYIAEFLPLLKRSCVRRTEWLRHIGTVQPHLIGVYLFVPVPSARGAGLVRELLMQEPSGLGVPGILSDAIKKKCRATHLD